MSFNVTLSVSTQKVKSTEEAVGVTAFETQNFTQEQLEGKIGKDIFRNYLYAGNIWENGKCSKKNYIGMSAVMFDFDQGTSLDDARTMFQNFHYIIHTTSSHRKHVPGKKGVQDRFRVILPLDTSDGLHYTNIMEHGQVNEELAEIYDSDPATTDAGRKFFPSFSDKELFELYINEGEEYFSYAPTPVIAENSQKMDEEDVPTFSLEDEVRTRNNENIQIKDIEEKTPIFCPFCDPKERSHPEVANAAINVEEGVPLLFCSSCKSRGRGHQGVYNLNADEQYKLDYEKQGVIIIYDKITDKFWNYSYSNITDSMRWHSIVPSNIPNFLKNMGMKKPNKFPVMDLMYRFDLPNVINWKKEVANRYVMPDHLKRSYSNPPKDMPPATKNVMLHLVGNDQYMYERLVNHVATMVNTGKKLLTAWLFRGTQGTGKNTFIERILLPIFGPESAQVILTKNFKSQFNAYLEENYILLIDEAYANFGDEDDVIASKLKTAITGSNRADTIEAKGQDSRAGRLNANIFLASNKKIPITLEPGDRRINVTPFQANKIINQLWWQDLGGASGVMSALDSEVEDVIAYLKNYDYDYNSTIESIKNKPRKDLIKLTQTYSQLFINAIEEGDLAWVHDHIQKPGRFEIRGSYKNCMKIVFDQLNNNDGKLTRDEMHELYENITGNFGWSKSKFTRMVHENSHKLEIKRIKLDGVTTQGLDNVKWNELPVMSEEDKREV